MGRPTLLYIICLLLFPLAFAGFALGFGCPVWMANSVTNSGLWQNCSTVFKDCRTLDFDSGEDWMIGVRAVEIFALVMLFVAAVQLIYESCCGNFIGRKAVARVAPGVFCVLGGLVGLSGIIVYVIKMEDRASQPGYEYGWAMMLVTAGSGLAFVLGSGFCVSGACFEMAQDPADKVPINAYGSGTPYLPSPSLGGESHEMTAFTNRALVNGGVRVGTAAEDGAPFFLPGHPTLFNNGLMARSSVSGYHDPHSRAGPLAASDLRAMQYHSAYGGGGGSREDLYPQFDLSEGYLPASRARGAPQPADVGRDEGAYTTSGRPRDLGSSARGENFYVDDPYYASGGRWLEDAYAPGGRGEGRGYDAYDDSRESFYRSGRF